VNISVFKEGARTDFLFLFLFRFYLFFFYFFCFYFSLLLCFLLLFLSIFMFSAFIFPVFIFLLLHEKDLLYTKKNYYSKANAFRTKSVTSGQRF